MAEQLIRCPLNTNSNKNGGGVQKKMSSFLAANRQKFENKPRVALGSISVNAAGQHTKAKAQDVVEASKKSQQITQPLKKCDFQVFCDDDDTDEQKKSKDHSTKVVRNESCGLSLEVFNLLIKPVQERRPLAPLPILTEKSHRLDVVRTNSRELFDLSSEPRREEYDDENSIDSVYVSALSSSRAEYFPAKEKIISPKEHHLNLIICPPDFVNDIYEHERKQEIRHKPRLRYMDRQPHVTPHMRMILVDWMVDVSVEYHLEDETLHLAVCYVDRFLSIMTVDKEKLQLVGTTALLIASKYEEIYPPELEQFVFITDDSYTMKQVLKMEHRLLTTLRFEMSSPTINFFLCHFLRVCQAEQRCECLARYLSELVLLDVQFLDYPPSVLAASIVCLANITTENVPWPVELEHASHYTVTDIFICMKKVLKTFQTAHLLSVQAVYEKYKEHKYCQVALLEPPDNLPEL